MTELRNYFESQFEVWTNLPVIVISMIMMVSIVIFYLVIGLIVSKSLNRALHRYFIKKKGDRRGLTIGNLVGGTVKFFVWFIVIILAISELGFNITPILASAGILGLAIGFGAQSLVKDIVSGFFIVVDNSYNVGETIEVGGFRGKVKSMNLRVTHLENWIGSEFIINNGAIGSITNWSRNNTTAIVDFGVDYATDLNKVATIMPEFLEQLKENYEDIIELPSFLGVTELADSSINLRIIAKTTNGNHFATERKIRNDLVLFLNKNKVEIPFPQVVVHSKSKNA